MFTTFLQHLIWKNRGADHNMPPPGLSSYSVLVSAYTILLHFLSKVFGIDDTCQLIKGSRQKVDTRVGFLHQGWETKFSCRLISKR